MSPRSYNCSAITNLSFLEKVRVLLNLGIQFPDNKGSPFFSKGESLQVLGSNSRAIKALSFCIKDSMGPRICQGELKDFSGHSFKIRENLCLEKYFLFIFKKNYRHSLCSIGNHMGRQKKGIGTPAC